MNNRILAGLFLAMLTPALASAQDAFNGTWKADMSKLQLPKKPNVFMVKDGTYQCTSCVPAVDIKADGLDHRVTGYPYFDTMSLKVLDDHAILETDKKNGKTVAAVKSTMSKDGKELAFEFTDSSDSNADPVTGKGRATRVAPAPAGADPISGSWLTTKMISFSDNAVTFTYKVTGDTLAMSSPTGQSYKAKLDGTEAPYTGDPGVSAVSIKRVSPNVIEETDKRGPQTVAVARMTVSTDGTTLHVTFTNTLQDRTYRYVAIKQ